MTRWNWPLLSALGGCLLFWFLVGYGVREMFR